jgi:filamentous hemagglutinin
VSLTAQHVATGQTSTVWAGRDVGYKPLRIGNNLAGNGSGIQIDGPGYLNVAAGRNIDLGSTEGILTNGNLHNPALPAEGAHITLLSGMGVDASGRPRQPDYAGFAASYLSLGSAALADYFAAIEDFEILRMALLQPENATLSYAAVQTRLKSPAYRAGMKTLAEQDITLAQAAFAALPLDVRARRVFYHELEMAGAEANQGLGYGRADRAIEAFFPSTDAAGQPIHYAGGVSGFFSQVRTNQGGDIEMLTPGGSVAIGLVNNPTDLAAFRKESDLGLFTVNGGSILAYSRDNFSVNTSRVFTLGQEKQPVRTSDFERLLRDDIMLFSLLGDIDAGKGAKTATAAPPPSYEYDSKGNLTVNLANSISGSGIGVLLAREVIVPGNASLIAPSGEVNAGDAGIRASGNLNIAAAHVVGANNIQVNGLSVGVAAAADTSGLSVSGVSNLGDAAKAASDATSSLANASEDAQKAAEEMKQNLAGFKPSYVSVEVLGFGDGTEACPKNDDSCRKQKKNGS